MGLRSPVRYAPASGQFMRRFKVARMLRGQLRWAGRTLFWPEPWRRRPGGAGVTPL